MESLRQNQEVKALISELKHEMFHQNHKIQEQQWRKELDQIVNTNSQKQKVLQQNQNILQKIVVNEVYTDKQPSSQNMENSNNITNFFSKYSNKTDYKYSKMNFDELEIELKKIETQYETNYQEMQEEQFYQKTLKLMKNRLQNDLDQLNLELQDVEYVNNLASKQNEKIEQELAVIKKEKNVIKFKQNQELKKLDQKLDIFDELLQRKVNLKDKTGGELLEIVSEYKDIQNFTREMEQEIKDQEIEIEKLDKQVELKYQEKTQSYDLIEILDNLEHLSQVFKSSDPGQYFDDDNQTMLKFKKISNVNQIWEILESASEQSYGCEQDSENTLNSFNIKDQKIKDITQRCSKIKIVHRLNIFYERNQHKIDEFFDNLINIHQNLFSNSEMLKTKIFNLEEEKKGLEQDYKKLCEETKQYKQYVEVDQQENEKSLNYILFNENNKENVVTSDTLLIEMKKLSLTSINFLYNIGKQFSKIKNITQNTISVVDPMIETTLQQQFREKFSDYDNEVNQFQDFIEQKLKLVKQDTQTEEFKINIQQMFSGQDIQFFIKLVGSDFLLKYFTNQNHLESQIRMKQGQELHLVINPILKTINEDAIYNFRVVTKNIMKFYEYFLIHIKDIKMDLKNNVLIPSQQVNLSQDIYLNENYEKLQKQTQLKAKKLDEEYKKEKQELKLQSSQNFDYQTTQQSFHKKQNSTNNNQNKNYSNSIAAQIHNKKLNKKQYVFERINSITSNSEIKSTVKSICQSDQVLEKQQNSQSKNLQNQDSQRKNQFNSTATSVFSNSNNNNKSNNNLNKSPVTQRQKIKQQQNFNKRQQSPNSMQNKINQNIDINKNSSHFEELDYIEDLRKQQQLQIKQSQQENFNRSRSAEPLKKRNFNNNNITKDFKENEIISEKNLLNNESDVNTANSLEENNTVNVDKNTNFYLKTFNSNFNQVQDYNSFSNNKNNSIQSLQSQTQSSIKVVKMQKSGGKQQQEEEKLKNMNFLVHQNEKFRQVKQQKDNQIKNEQLQQQYFQNKQVKMIKHLTNKNSNNTNSNIQFMRSKSPQQKQQLQQQKQEVYSSNSFLPYLPPKQNSKIINHSQNNKINFRSLSPQSRKQQNNNNSKEIIENQNIQQQKKEVLFKMYSRSPK